MLEPLWSSKGLLWKAISPGSGQGVCSPSLDANRWQAWLEQLPGLLGSAAAHEICYSSLLSTGRRTFRLCGADEWPVIVKSYPPVSADAESRLRGGRHEHPSWTAFRCHVELWQQQLPVPEPLAFAEMCQAKSGSVCYVISRLLEGCQPLTHFAFEHLCRRSLPPALLEQWAATVVEVIARLHWAGYSHGDLHHHNILVRGSVPEDSLQAFFTDFDACERHVEDLPHQAQLNDLASLAASLYQLAPDGLLARACVHYFRSFQLEGAGRKQCLQKIQQEYRAFLSHYQTCFQRVEEFYFAQAENHLRAVNLSS